MTPRISVVVPTHNPHAGRLHQTLAALGVQTLPPTEWETVLVNNASTQFPKESFFNECALTNLRVIKEPVLGLTSARRRGLHESIGEIVVFADDDNVFAPDYLAHTQSAFSRLPKIGALGGKSLPHFETVPPDWANEFFPLLALRDLGEKELISSAQQNLLQSKREYPLFSPIGAGMAVRREAIQSWLKHRSALSDRRGNELTSSGDNDMVLFIMEAGWEVAYNPQLILTHLIPASRLDRDYLARLNRGIRKSWVQVLLAHNACPWPRVPRWSVPMRQTKAWLTHRAWSSSAAHIRWQGACGQFEGLAET